MSPIEKFNKECEERVNGYGTNYELKKQLKISMYLQTNIYIHIILHGWAGQLYNILKI